MTFQDKQFKENVTKAIELLKSIDVNAFYTAIALYDIAGVEKPTMAQCRKTFEVVDSVETIYDELLREDVYDAAGIKFD